jgi:hypothetical protein
MFSVIILSDRQRYGLTLRWESSIRLYIGKARAGNTNRGVRLSTVELLIKVACFVKQENNIFNIKTS